MEFNNIENNSNYISRLTLMHNKNYYIDNLYLISLRMIKDIYKGEVSSIMFCDINGLKLVNDSSGHLEGDKIIRRIANIIRNCVKKGNNLSDNITNPTSQESDKRKNEIIHLGGDEFLVVLPKCNKEKARTIKENIYNIIDEKIEFLDGASLSIGIADTTDIELPKNIDISNIEEVVEYAHAIIKLADKNMYKENWFD